VFALIFLDVHGDKMGLLVEFVSDMLVDLCWQSLSNKISAYENHNVLVLLKQNVFANDKINAFFS
jgi:hypothetical protein